MYQPKYQLTPKLLTNITQIERLYGQLEGLKIPKKLELNLERTNLIKSSYISNSIEGNSLSLPEVTNLLLNDRVPVNRDEKEVKNYFQILKELDKYIDTNISLSIVKELHQRLLWGVNNKIAGQIRNKKIVIGTYVKTQGLMKLKVKHEPPFHLKREIEGALELLFQWLEKEQSQPLVIKAGAFHHQFVYLHPFEDGNGRVDRLLTAIIFLKNGYLINKYFVLDDYYDIDRIEYSNKLNSADKGDKTQWLEYFTDGVNYSLQSALGRIKEGLKSLSIEERPTPKEKKVLEIFQKNKEMTSLELADILNISRQQAHNLLSGLVNKGFLAKKGTTKGSYYLLK